MKSRDDLQTKLEALLGSEYVYFQPPDGLQLYKGNKIVYKRDKVHEQKANNKSYVTHGKYTVTLISRDPDWDLPLQFTDEFDHCDYDRTFISNNSYHNVFILYY